MTCPFPRLRLVLCPQESNLKRVKGVDLKVGIHRMEIERIRYVLSSYLRCRLGKVTPGGRGAGAPAFPVLCAGERHPEAGGSVLLRAGLGSNGSCQRAPDSGLGEL